MRHILWKKHHDLYEAHQTELAVIFQPVRQGSGAQPLESAKRETLYVWNTLDNGE